MEYLQLKKTYVIFVELCLIREPTVFCFVFGASQINIKILLNEFTFPKISLRPK